MCVCIFILNQNFYLTQAFFHMQDKSKKKQQMTGFFELKNNELTDKGPGVVRHFSLKRSVMFDKKTGLEMCS